MRRGLVCTYCGQPVYAVLNPRTGNTFLVNSYTGKVHCDASPLPPQPLP